MKRGLFSKKKTSLTDVATELNKYDERVLTAADKGDVSTFKNGLKKGGSLTKSDSDGNTALHLACRGGHMNVVELILQHDVNCLNLGDQYDRKPVHVACKAGHLLCLQLLISNRQDLSLVLSDADGFTPLHFAANGGHLEVVKYLLQRNCPASPVSKEGETPLILAARQNYVAVSKELLNRGADVNAFDLKHKTPLMHACEQGCKEIVDLLLRRGAKVDAIDLTEMSAIDYAIEGEHKEIKDRLDTAPRTAIAGWSTGFSGDSKASPAQAPEEDRVHSFDDSPEMTHVAANSTDSVSPYNAASYNVQTQQLTVRPAPKGSKNEDSTQLQALIKELQEENEMLNQDMSKLANDKRYAEEKVKELERRVAEGGQRGSSGHGGDETDSDPDNDEHEQLEDLQIQLGQSRRELRREVDQRKKAEEEVNLLRAQLATYQTDDHMDDEEADFSDMGDDLPGMDDSPTQQTAGPTGLLQAQEIISQLRGQVATLRLENESLKESGGGRRPKTNKDNSAELKAKIVALEKENAQLQDQLEEEGKDAEPSVPLGVYQEFKLNKEQEMASLHNQLLLVQEELQEAQMKDDVISSAQLQQLSSELSAIKAVMEERETEHADVIQRYRAHLLLAVRGVITSEVQNLVSEIWQLRQTEQVTVN